MNDLLKTRDDLIRKNYVPKRSISMLTDLNSLKSQLHNYQFQQFREMSCPRCMITITGPKEWMIEHVKTHNEGKERRGITHNYVKPY